MKQRGIVQILTVGFVALGLTACGYYHEAAAPPAQAPLQSGQKLGFEVVKTIFQRNRCFECHTVEKGNRGGVNLETHASAAPLAASINSAVASGFMPLGGPRVAPADQEILAAWAAAGAPEVSDLPLPGESPVAPAPTPAPLPVPAEPDFTAVKAAIFTPHCIGCHAGFADYARVAGRLPDIQRAIDTNFMPKNGPPLNADLKRLLADWIAAGAPEGGGQADGGGTGDDDEDDDDDDDDDDNEDDFTALN